MPQGISLHLGLNSYDPNHYGDSGDLAACENDAHSMHNLAKAAGFNALPPLLTAQATTRNFVTNIQNAARTLESGDVFMLTYSGHGGQVWDYSGDEAKDEDASIIYENLDGSDKIILEEGPKDETLCLYDRQFWDDEVFNQLRQFKKGVRVIWITDCCHAASNFKDIEGDEEVKVRGIGVDKGTDIWTQHQLMYKDAWLGTVDSRSKDRELNCSLVQLAACSASELARDGNINGLFTTHLLSVWDQGNFNGSYSSFLDRVSLQVNAKQSDQTPKLVIGGASGADFQNQQPFSI